MLEIINTFISSIILIVTVFIFGKIIINNTKFNNKTRLIVYILVVAILNTLIYLYTKGSTKTILTCILYILTFKRDNYRIKSIIKYYGGVQLHTNKIEEVYILPIK